MFKELYFKFTKLAFYDFYVFGEKKMLNVNFLTLKVKSKKIEMS